MCDGSPGLVPRNGKDPTIGITPGDGGKFNFSVPRKRNSKANHDPTAAHKAKESQATSEAKLSMAVDKRPARG